MGDGFVSRGSSFTVCVRRCTDETSEKNVYEKIDKDDLRENGQRKGVKLIVGAYLRFFENFRFYEVTVFTF